VRAAVGLTIEGGRDDDETFATGTALGTLLGAGVATGVEAMCNVANQKLLTGPALTSCSSGRRYCAAASGAAHAVEGCQIRN